MNTPGHPLLCSPALMVMAGMLCVPVHGQHRALPDTIGAWIRTEKVGIFQGQELFLLIDGGADLFFEYGFRRALATAYGAPSQQVIAVELYEMHSAQSAFGLYSSFARGGSEAADVGTEAVRGEGYLIFWKGACVGMFSTSDTGHASIRDLTDIARSIALGMEDGAGVPALCMNIREAGFPGRSMVYVRGKLALSNTLPFAWVDALPASEGVAGEHAGCHYIALDYGDSTGAERALLSAGQGWERVRGLTVQDSAHGRTLRRPGEAGARLEVWEHYVVGAAGADEQLRVHLLTALRNALRR